MDKDKQRQCLLLKQDDLIFGIIIMFFITPVASVGLFLFGKYALAGEYNEHPIKNKKRVAHAEEENL